ncbi:hypothetical protein [Sphingobium yanoikuyae]|uniref:hypothetical protein n=1 Tax=Sphingobium yanoikuyae TaxID=13690 RepID=UPI00345F0A07
MTRLLLAERNTLLRLAQRIVGTTPAAEDVTQSLWFRVQRIDDEPPIINKRAFSLSAWPPIWRTVSLACRQDGQRKVFDSGELPIEIAADIPSAETRLVD